jgi:hypothetical protein
MILVKVLLIVTKSLEALQTSLLLENNSTRSFIRNEMACHFTSALEFTGGDTII